MNPSTFLAIFILSAILLNLIIALWDVGQGHPLILMYIPWSITAKQRFIAGIILLLICITVFEQLYYGHFRDSILAWILCIGCMNALSVYYRLREPHGTKN